MMQSIRSLTELRLICQSREEKNTKTNNVHFNTLVEDSGQRKRYIRSKEERRIHLPNIPKASMPKWKRSKDSLSRSLDDLENENQIKSSYFEELIGFKKKKNGEEAA